MLRDSSWSRAEIEAWAACKPLVPPDSPMAPRQEAVHNDLVQTVAVPGAGHCVRRDQSARYLRAVDAFLAEVARDSQARDEEALRSSAGRATYTDELTVRPAWLMARVMARVLISDADGCRSRWGNDAQFICMATLFACGAGDGNRTRTVSLGMVTLPA
jgi:hypothetical protein